MTHDLSAAARGGDAGSSRSPSLRIVAALLLAAALLATARYAQHALIMHPVEESEALPEYLPNSEFLRLVSVGYGNVVADVLWFRTINYFGKHYRSDRLYPWLARMCDVVTDLDPKAFHVYRFAGVILPWEAGDPDAGIRILEKGVGAFPDSWHLRFLLGFNYFFFRNDYEKAIPQIRRATELPGVHPVVSRLAALLYAEEHGPATARAFLEELQRSTEAGDVRNLIEENIKDLRLTEDLSTLEAAITAYRERHGVVPPSLQDLVAGGLLAAVPIEPFGGVYLYDSETGAVRSSLGKRRQSISTSEIRAKALGGSSIRE